MKSSKFIQCEKSVSFVWLELLLACWVSFLSKVEKPPPLSHDASFASFPFYFFTSR